MWLIPRTNWKSNDDFEFFDYNRIKNNIQHIRDLAVTMFRSFPIAPINNIWHDVIYFDDLLNNVEKNVETIHNNTTKFIEFQPSKMFVENTKFWTPDDLNRLESNLLLFYQRFSSQNVNRKILSYELDGDFFG